MALSSSHILIFLFVFHGTLYSFERLIFVSRAIDYLVTGFATVFPCTRRKSGDRRMTEEKSRLETGDGGGEIVLRDVMGNSRATILRSLFVDDENRSYSSMMVTSSSLKVTLTSTSRSSIGNLHFKVIEDPHSSKNLTISSANVMERSTERTLVWPPT